MAIAHDIEKLDPLGLPALIMAILRPLQSEHILSVAERPPHRARDGISVDTLFSTHMFFSTFDEDVCCKLPAEGFCLDLRRHIIFTTPWNRPGFASALATIGTGKRNGPWLQDFINHRVTLMLPWGIGIVNGGNHSIAAGILAGEGEIKPGYAFDFAPLLATFRCDGKHLIEIASGKKVTEVHDQRLAAVFEIGRLMLPHGELLYPLAKSAEIAA